MMSDPLEPFCLLANPARYVACDWDLSTDAEGRAHWGGFFRRHFDTILRLAREAAEARSESGADVGLRAALARAELHERFENFETTPGAHGRITMLDIDRWRDDTLRKHGFADAFVDLKARENERMLPLLPKVCAELDGLSGETQLRAIVEGVFAGNIFDMGAEATAKAFLGSSPDFFRTRSSLPKRPWLVDDYDALVGRLTGSAAGGSAGPHRKAVFFIDNAGSDFLLGALPMIRWMAQCGTRVVLAANERPTLNDMTIHDVRAWWPRILGAEPGLKGLPIDLVSTGTGDPLIDLSAVSRELNRAARGADLVIIEGMGRAVESNLDADFSCDALNIAMLKDPIIAKRLGGKTFDVVCRFRAARVS